MANELVINSEITPDSNLEITPKKENGAKIFEIKIDSDEETAAEFFDS